LFVKDLLEAKGKRQLAYVEVAREEEAIAASEAGMGCCQTNLTGLRLIPIFVKLQQVLPLNTSMLHLKSSD